MLGFLSIQHSNWAYRQIEICLYRGLGLAAWRGAIALRNHLAVSLLSRIQHLRVCMHDILARSALAAIAAGEDPHLYLRRAAYWIRRLERERTPCASAWARLLCAGVAAIRQDTTTACRLFAEAASACEALDMLMHAAAAQRRRGQLLDGEEGRRLVEAADSWMAGQLVRNPARMTAMLAPGYRGDSGLGPGT